MPNLRSMALAALILLGATAALAAPPEPTSQNAQDALEEALQLDQRLDASLRELALDAGRTISFTLAAGRALRGEELEKLLAAYEAALRLQPDNALAAAGKARALAALNRPVQAKAAYERALALDPANQRLGKEMAALENAQSAKSKFAFSYSRQREYWPGYARHVYVTHDTTYQAQAEAPVAEGWRMAAGYLWGSLRQESLVYGDNDFDLKRRGYYLAGEWRPRPELQVNLRLRRELFSNQDQSAYFKLPDDQELITGHALVQYSEGPWWLNASFSRERDAWPQVDMLTGRGLLAVKARELAGLAAGRALGRDWELVASLFYEIYDTPRPDQANINAQVIHRPLWLPGLRLALGAGHYQQEAENLGNLLLGYQMKLAESLALDLSHQLEYARNERSWLSQLDLALTWRPWPWLGFTALGSYGREYDGDQDEYWSMELGLEFVW